MESLLVKLLTRLENQCFLTTIGGMTRIRFMS